MKKRTRDMLLKKRDAIPQALREQKDQAIRKRLFGLEEFRNAGKVMLYVSFRSETDTKKCLPEVIASGKTLILPRVDSRRKMLELYEVRDVSELVPGYMGILEPGIRANRRVEANAADLIIVPGAGFDVKGNRIGYGGGYYDRLLSGLRGRGTVTGKKERDSTVQPHATLFVALAFEDQVMDEIPSEPHDIKMDMIVTDTRLIRCARN